MLYLIDACLFLLKSAIEVTLPTPLFLVGLIDSLLCEDRLLLFALDKCFIIFLVLVFLGFRSHFLHLGKVLLLLDTTGQVSFSLIDFVSMSLMLLVEGKVFLFLVLSFTLLLTLFNLVFTSDNI